MNFIQYRDEEPDREYKLGFAAETMLVLVAFGAFISQFLMSIFVHPFESFLHFVFGFLIRGIGYTFMGLPGMVLFGFLFRMCIFVLDVVKIDSSVKMNATIIAGISIIVFTLHIFLGPYNELTERGRITFFIYAFSYGAALIFWVLHRNIWNSIRNSGPDNPDILDDLQD